MAALAQALLEEFGQVLGEMFYPGGATLSPSYGCATSCSASSAEAWLSVSD